MRFFKEILSRGLKLGGWEAGRLGDWVAEKLGAGLWGW